MRLPLIAQADLSPEQRPIYEDMRAGIERSFQGFKSISENGALIGPWNPWLHESKFGKPIWELTKALSASPSLPKPVREVAILVTGAKFRSANEIYAHVQVTRRHIGCPAHRRQLVRLGHSLRRSRNRHGGHRRDR